MCANIVVSPVYTFIHSLLPVITVLPFVFIRCSLTVHVYKLIAEHLVLCVQNQFILPKLEHRPQLVLFDVVKRSACRQYTRNYGTFLSFLFIFLLRLPVLYAGLKASNLSINPVLCKGVQFVQNNFVVSPVLFFTFFLLCPSYNFLSPLFYGFLPF